MNAGHMSRDGGRRDIEIKDELMMTRVVDDIRQGYAGNTRSGASGHPKHEARNKSLKQIQIQDIEFNDS